MTYIHPAYGQTFKELREQHHVTTSAFETAGISHSRISKFENAKAMLGVDEFDTCLDQMGVSLAEFDFQLNNYERDADEQIFADLTAAYYARDAERVKELMDETGNHIIELSIKSIYNELTGGGGLTDEEQDEIMEYLFDIERWGIIELNVLNCIVLTLNGKLSLSLFADFWKNADSYYNIFKYRRKINQIALKSALNFLSMDMPDHAKLLLDRSEKYIKEDDLLCKNIYLFVSGVYEYKYKDKEKGEKRVEQAITVFKILNCKDMANFTKWLWALNK